MVLFPKISSNVLQTTAEKFGGDYLNRLSDYYNGIDISPSNDLYRPLIKTITRFGNEVFRLAMADGHEYIFYLPESSSQDKAIFVPAMSGNASDSLVLEREVQTLEGKIISQLVNSIEDFNVEDIANSNIANKQNNDVLTWNAAESKWKNLPAPGASGGEANTGSNVGTGEGSVFKDKSGVDLRLRTLKQGSNITISTGIDEVTIAGGAPGEVNTASNVGTAGVGVFKNKSLADLRFKKLNVVSTGRLSVIDDTTNDEIDFDIPTGAIANDRLAGSISQDKLAGSIPDSKLSQITDKAKLPSDNIYSNIFGGADNFVETPMIRKTGKLIPVSSTLADNMDGLFKMSASANGTIAIQALDTTNGKALRMTSGAANGNNTGVNLYDSCTCRAFNCYMAIRFRIQTLTAMRLFIGFQSNTGSTFIGTDTPLASLSGFGFAKLSTSGNWQIIRNDGDATQDNTDTGITADTGWHTIILFADAANNRFGYSFDGGAITYFTTEIPGSTTALTFSTILYTTEAASKWIEYLWGFIRSDK